jgi:hypothetical protein
VQLAMIVIGSIVVFWIANTLFPTIKAHKTAKLKIANLIPFIFFIIECFKNQYSFLIYLPYISCQGRS